MPLVSIVTPCLNAARFIGETVRSVLDQDYPDIEYLIVDGASTDNTLDVLASYGTRVRVASTPDRGQADAVNRGFAQTRGSVFAFLNADDLYHAGAIRTAVEAFAVHPEAAAVYGEARYIDESGRAVGSYPVEPFDPAVFARRCYICQPAAFVRRYAFGACGMLDASLRYAMDYDFWIRLSASYPMVKIDRVLADSRLHAASKTLAEMPAAMLETIEVLRRHYGYVPYNWLYGYAHRLRTQQALASTRPVASFGSACQSLAMGARYNWRHPIRFGMDILSTAREGLA
ncbi:MAG: glycosyltransferase family 2 protein [Bryobacteraceae bacterium]|jgi:glycosyltransferase involved in cell wall biosynthesis